MTPRTIPAPVAPFKPDLRCIEQERWYTAGWENAACGDKDWSNDIPPDYRKFYRMGWADAKRWRGEK